MMLENVLTGSNPLQNGEDSRQITPANNRSDIRNQNKEAIQDEEVINTDKVKTVVTELNEMIKPLRTNLQFKLHEELNEYYVTVVNPLTHEVIKEIPPKQMLDKYAAMVEFMGLLVDEKI